MKETELQSDQPEKSYSTKALFWRLWRDWVRKYLGRLLLIFIFMIIISASSGAYPVLIGYVFNGLSVASPDLIWQMPALIVIIAAIRSVAMYSLAKETALLSLLVTRELQKQMASHMITTDLRDIMSQPSGTFVSRMTNDVNIIREALVRLINNLIKDSLMIIILVGVMISFDWLLTLFVLGDLSAGHAAYSPHWPPSAAWITRMAGTSGAGDVNLA
jgi:subfamily B ATP-binding cassette protein MsbA